MVEFLKAAGFWQEGRRGGGKKGGHSYCTAAQLPLPAAAGVQRTLLISTAPGVPDTACKLLCSLGRKGQVAC